MSNNLFEIITREIFVFAELKFPSPLIGKIKGDDEQSDGQSYNHSKYRFTASLTHNNVPICTAILLSNKNALTSALCLKDFLNQYLCANFDLYKVVAGRLDIPGESTTFDIEEVVAHTKYRFKSPNPRHDLGYIVVNYKSNIEYTVILNFNLKFSWHPEMLIVCPIILAISFTLACINNFYQFHTFKDFRTKAFSD